MRHELALREEDDQLDDVPADLMIAAAGPGYGRDPNLVTPIVTWSLTLSDHQRRLVGQLSDLILPETPDCPAPSRLGISEFFDEWVSAPYGTQSSHRAVIVRGLRWIDDTSKTKFGTDFLQLTEEQKKDIVEFWANNWPQRQFFKRFRYLVVGGYFSTDLGATAIGYKGNIPLNEYPKLPRAIESMVERELCRLGLSNNIWCRIATKFRDCLDFARR